MAGVDYGAKLKTIMPVTELRIGILYIYWSSSSEKGIDSVLFFLVIRHKHLPNDTLTYLFTAVNLSHKFGANFSCASSWSSVRLELHAIIGDLCALHQFDTRFILECKCFREESRTSTNVEDRTETGI